MKLKYVLPVAGLAVFLVAAGCDKTTQTAPSAQNTTPADTMMDHSATTAPAPTSTSNDKMMMHDNAPTNSNTPASDGMMMHK